MYAPVRDKIRTITSRGDRYLSHSSHHTQVPVPYLSKLSKNLSKSESSVLSCILPHPIAPSLQSLPCALSDLSPYLSVKMGPPYPLGAQSSSTIYFFILPKFLAPFYYYSRHKTQNVTPLLQIFFAHSK